jgi:hypothetical protein
MMPGLSGFADKLLDPLDIMPRGLKKVVAPGQQATLDRIAPPPKAAEARKPLARTSSAVVGQNEKAKRTALLVSR